MISRVGCLQTGVFSLPRIWPLELHWPRAPMDSTGRWYVASDVWHPTLFRSGVQCTAHRTTHTHRRLDCRSRTRTRKPLHSSPPSPQLPQPPSHHGPLVFLGCAFPATAPPPSTPPSPHTALARSPRRPPRRVAHSPPPHRLAIASSYAVRASYAVPFTQHRLRSVTHTQSRRVHRNRELRQIYTLGHS